MIMAKLNIHEIAGLVRYAIEHGLISVSAPLGYDRTRAVPFDPENEPESRNQAYDSHTHALQHLIDRRNRQPHHVRP